MKCSSFAAEEIDFQKKLKKEGFQYLLFPNRRFHFCCADKVDSFLIAPDGNLYKCFEEAGNKIKSIGKYFNF